MDGRGEEYCDNNEKNDTREERIRGGEQFSSRRTQSIDGSHPSQDHGGVNNGIDPSQSLESMITEDAYPQ